MHRVLLRLSKGEGIKYISHLDLVRAFEFALRRAAIPVEFSAGFNPRPKMSFGTAVGVGVSSEDERVVLDLTEPVDVGEIRDRLNATLPPGLQVVSAEVVAEGAKPLSALDASEFRVTLVCVADCDPALVHKVVDELLACPEIRVKRVQGDKVKEIDLRQYLLQAQVSGSDAGAVSINVSLRSTSSGGGRPQDFIVALQEKAPGLRTREIRRLRQFAADRG